MTRIISSSRKRTLFYLFFFFPPSLPLLTRAIEQSEDKNYVDGSSTFASLPFRDTIPCEKERSEEIDLVKRFYGTRSKPVPSVRPTPHTPTPGTNSGWSNAMYRDIATLFEIAETFCVRRVVAHRSCRITRFFMQSARQAFATAPIELLSIIFDRRLLRYTVTLRRLVTKIPYRRTQLPQRRL